MSTVWQHSDAEVYAHVAAPDGTMVLYRVTATPRWFRAPVLKLERVNTGGGR